MFNQPYPTSEKSPVGLLLAGLIPGVLLALFLISVQPFGTDAVNFPGKTAFLAGYGIITAVAIWLANLIPVMFFGAERWTVGRQICLILLLVFLGVTASYFYLLQLGGNVDWRGYRVFVINAMSISSVPIVGAILFDYYLEFRKYDSAARAFSFREKTNLPGKTATEPTAVNSTSLVVTDDQDRPIVTLPTDRIWCLRSDRNYVDIFHLSADDQVAKTTVRNTLTKLSTDLPEHFLRCHRSYVVNASLVGNVSGNAQGYRLHCGGFAEEAVPVSRSKSAEILSCIQADG